MGKLSVVLLSVCFLLLACSSVSSSKESFTTNEVINITEEPVDFQNDTILTKEGRKLRYLFFANGGLIGYFDDSTVVGCPRCDLLDVNIESMYSAVPFKTYTVRDDGSLLVENSYVEYPREAGENEFAEWAMIDYKWIIIPEKYKEE